MAKTMGVWREQLTHDATTTSATVYSNAVPEGERWFLDRLAFDNEQRSTMDVKTSIESGAERHVIHYQSSITKDEPASVQLQLWLRQGERLRFDVSDIVAGDRVTIWVTGNKLYQV